MADLIVTAQRDRRRAGRRFLKGQPVRIKAGALKKGERATLEADPVLVVETAKPEAGTKKQGGAEDAPDGKSDGDDVKTDNAGEPEPDQDAAEQPAEAPVKSGGATKGKGGKAAKQE